MHNPPHPGQFIIQVYLDPNNLSGRELAGKLGVAASTLNRSKGGRPTLVQNNFLRIGSWTAVGPAPLNPSRQFAIENSNVPSRTVESAARDAA
jgi:hypothetical protein